MSEQKIRGSLISVHRSLLVLLLAGFALLLVGRAPAQEAEAVQEAGWELHVCAVLDNLPYSNRELQGFENRIAALLADEIGASLHYVWLSRTHDPELEASLLREGICDVFMGVADGQEPFLSTIAYYRSGAVFAVRADAPFSVTSLDDPVLHELTVGVMRSSPADFALAGRGLIENVRHYFPRDGVEAIIDGLMTGELDLAIVWGPVAGYAARDRGNLILTPVSPQIDLPFLPLVLPVSIGVRKTDEALRDQLNEAIAVRWDEIQAVLQEFNVPLLPLPRPLPGPGGD
jgi:quinoprotein dehydrogenase-associated probable ABC transporter substrate-binding protein